MLWSRVWKTGMNGKCRQDLANRLQFESNLRKIVGPGSTVCSSGHGRISFTDTSGVSGEFTRMRHNRAEGQDLQDLDVVFVEDNRQDQAILRSILATARIGRTRAFSNAQEAHRAMLTDPPHVVLADVGTPGAGADGLTLIRSMRDPRSGPLSSVPAILISSSPTRTMIERAIGLGVHHVVAKPLSPSSVIRRLQAVAADPRGFIFDETLGHFVLEDRDRLIAGQRQRWDDLLQGVRAFRNGRETVRRQVEPQPAPTPVPAPEVVDETKNRRLWGLDAPKRRKTVETSTGQRIEGTA